MQKIKQAKLLKQLDRYQIKIVTATDSIKEVNAAELLGHWLKNLSKQENIVNISYYKIK